MATALSESLPSVVVAQLECSQRWFNVFSCVTGKSVSEKISKDSRSFKPSGCDGEAGHSRLAGLASV